MLHGLFFCVSLCLCGIWDRKMFVWIVCTVVSDVVWFVFSLCVFVCLCGAVVLKVFVCFVCELLRDNVSFVFFCVLALCCVR